MVPLWQRLKDLPRHLSRTERYLFIGLLVSLLLLGGVALRRFVRNRTTVVPAAGGTLVEGLVGQPKLLSVLSASEANDRAVLALLYPGLTHTTADGQTHPVLAESWTIEDDGRTYRFVLQEGLTWHDGTPLTTSDIAETVSRVLDPELQSPYLEDWTGVTVEVVDPRTIKFRLAEPVASFLSATSLPLTPLHLAVADLQRSLVGSGPYRFIETRTEDQTVKEIILARYDNWIGERPYLDQVVFRFFADAEALATAYQKRRVDSMLTDQTDLPGQHFDLATQRLRLLILNTGRAPFDNLETRRRFLAGEQSANPLNLKLVTHESLAGHPVLTERLARWADNGATVEVKSLASLPLLEIIDTHDYDLLFVDVDMGADLDRYPLWHSSQRGTGGLNFAQLADNELDKLLVEAHTTVDLESRRVQTEKIEARLGDLAVAQTLEQVHLQWFVNEEVKGIIPLSYVVAPEDRFFGLTGWFVKTALVRSP